MIDQKVLAKLEVTLMPMEMVVMEDTADMEVMEAMVLRRKRRKNQVTEVMADTVDTAVMVDMEATETMEPRNLKLIMRSHLKPHKMPKTLIKEQLRSTSLVT